MHMEPFSHGKSEYSIVAEEWLTCHQFTHSFTLE